MPVDHSPGSPDAANPGPVRIRLAGALGALAGIQVALGFLYQWYVLTFLGAGEQTDALFASLVVPQLVLAVAGGALTHVLTPMLAILEKEKLARQGWSIFQTVALFLAVFALLLALAAPIWVLWTVPGFDPTTLALTTTLTRIQLLAMVAAGLVGVLRSVCHARGRFVLAEVGPVLGLAAGFAFFVWALPRLGVRAVAWAAVLNSVIQAACLAPALGPYQRPDWRTGASAEVGRRIRPLLLGNLYLKSEDLVDRFLASMAPTGDLTLLHIAQQIYDTGSGVVYKVVTGPLVPRLAQTAGGGDWRGFRRLTRRGLCLVAGLAIAVFVAILIVGRPVLTFVFAHGRMGVGDTRTLWFLLIALAGVWIGGVTGLVLASSFYARGDTRTPVRVSVVGFTVGVLLKVAGFRQWGVAGIALASSCYYALNALILCWLQDRLAHHPTMPAN